MIVIHLGRHVDLALCCLVSEGTVRGAVDSAMVGIAEGIRAVALLDEGTLEGA